MVGQLASGSGLLEAIVKTIPDIVCLDYHLTDSDGMDLLREVRGAHPDVSVVMITGAKGYIVKPFHPDKVMSVIGKIFV